MKKLTSKVNDIILIADAPLMGGDGSSTTAIKLFKDQVMTGLTFLTVKAGLG